MNKMIKLNITGSSEGKYILETMKPQRKTFLKEVNNFYFMKIVKVLASQFKLMLYILPLILILFFSKSTSAHTEGGTGDTLDTGSNLSGLSIIFVGFGVGMFLLILLSGIWLLRREKLDIENPETYADKIKLFSKNARLYIIHIQGMSLTYGIRSILYNFYLLYIFKDGVNLFGYELRTIFFIGILFAMGSIVAGVMAPYNGIFVDKLGKKWSFIVGDFIGATMVLLIIFFQPVQFVIFAHIFRAAAMSIHSIAEAPFIYEQSTSKERVHLFSVSSGMSTFASMSGNLIGGVVPLAIAIALYNNPIVSGSASTNVLRFGLFISVLLWWASLIPAFFMTEDPVLKHKAQEMSVSSRLRFKNVKNWRTVGVFVLSSIFIGLGAGMFANFFEIFFFLLFTASPAEISIIFAFGALFIAIGNLVSPILAEKYGKVNMIVGTRMVSIVFMILLPLAPGLLLAGFFYLFRGLFMNSTGPTENALAMEVVDDEERTTLEALRQAGASIFAAIGFLVGSYYMSRGIFVTPFIFASILYFIATLVFWLHFRNFEGIKLDDLSPTATFGE